MPYYFTKINNYKGGKNEPIQSGKRLEKASLKIENKITPNIHLKHNCNIPNNSTHLKLKYNR
jgi:hypothetical protein